MKDQIRYIGTTDNLTENDDLGIFQDVSWKTITIRVPWRLIQRTKPFTTYRFKNEDKNPFTGEFVNPRHLRDEPEVSFHRGYLNGKSVWITNHKGVRHLFTS